MRATDSKTTVTESFLITVLDNNQAPQFSGLEQLYEIKESEFLVSRVTATDANKDPITLSAHMMPDRNAAFLPLCHGGAPCASSCLDNCISLCKGVNQACNIDCAPVWQSADSNAGGGPRQALAQCVSTAFNNCETCLRTCSTTCGGGLAGEAHGIYIYLPDFDQGGNARNGFKTYVTVFKANDGYVTSMGFIQSNVAHVNLAPRMRISTNNLTVLEGTTEQVHITAEDYEGDVVDIRSTMLSPDGELDVQSGPSAQGRLKIPALYSSSEENLTRRLVSVIAYEPDAPAVSRRLGLSVHYVQSATPILALPTDLCSTTLSGGGGLSTPGMIATGDLNNDGMVDLIHFSLTRQIQVYLTWALPKFSCSAFSHLSEVNAPSASSALALGDVNGDLLGDIIYNAGSRLYAVQYLGGTLFMPPVESNIPVVELSYILPRHIDSPHLDLFAFGRNQAGNDAIMSFKGLGNGTFVLGGQKESPLAPMKSKLVSGDFNHDGYLDVAWVGADKLAVSYGTGLSLSVPATFDVLGATDLIAGDLNNDQADDLAVLTGNGRVSVFLGSASGISGFESTNIPPASGQSRFTLLAAGDVNGDGISDLFAVDSGNQRITTLPGNGYGSTPNGTFTYAQQIATGSKISFIKAERFLPNLKRSQPSILNLLDLLVINGNNGEYAVRYPGNPVIAPQATGRFIQTQPLNIGISPQRVKIDDLNGDGIFDLITSNTDGSYSVLLGVGNGGMWSQEKFNNIPATGNIIGEGSIASGDFNCDGIPDLVILGDTATLLTGTGRHGVGSGNYSSYDTGILSANSEVFTGDFNGDGVVDLGFSGADWIEIHINTCMGGRNSFSRSWRYDGLAGKVVAQDINGDGILDLASSHGNIFLGQGASAQGSGGFSFHSRFVSDAGYSDSYIVAGDVNNDTLIDLAVANRNSGKIDIYSAGRAAGTWDGSYHLFGSAQAAPLISRLMGQDFNSDGRMDLAWFSESSADRGKVNVLLMQDGVLSPVEYQVCSPIKDLSSWDFFNTGTTDIMVLCEGKIEFLVGERLY